MLQPKKTKFRRAQKGMMKGNAQRGNQLAFGSFGIKILEEAWLTGRQLEAARQAVTRHMKREGQILSLIHISEPTRRTPISYAVFCLKKKKKINKKNTKD